MMCAAVESGNGDGVPVRALPDRRETKANVAGQCRAERRRGECRPDRRREARASVMVVWLVTALLVGAGGGSWLSRRLASGDAAGTRDGVAGSAEAKADAVQWYTCGMHPDVLLQSPGDCPICQMKLTPRKDDEDDADDGGPAERRVLYWRAPMDPNFVSESPGKSPMGMDLVPVYADADGSASVHTIRIDPVTIQNMGIRTTTVTRGPLVRRTRTIGRVDYDEQLVTFIDTKFNGWIETLHVDETGQRVSAGDPLFDVYSPELYAAQEEYLAAFRSVARFEKNTYAPVLEEAHKMLEAAKTKLRYLDVSDEQIELLRVSQKVAKTMTIHSPATGIVTEKMALEGMYVKPGMRLFTIADLSRVWVYVDVYEYQLPWVSVGQTATMTLSYVPGKEFVGHVVYIYPYLDERSRVIKVRLEFENPTMELKPGMFTNITLHSQLQRDALLIPREAFIDSGTRKIAFVALGGGKFAGREIEVGVETEDGVVELLYGLDEGEVVVTSGQFLLDAESKLKEAVAKMKAAVRAGTTKRSLRADETATEAASPDDETSDVPAGIPDDARYACPMETHPDEDNSADQGAYFSAEEGRCPSCGMAYKPLDGLEWVRVRRAAGGGDVAYTCSEHQKVFSDTSESCPRCGRPLVPFKVMYTCPDPEHARVVSGHRGNCRLSGKGLAAFRGVWLDESLAEREFPTDPGIADQASYRCSIHPLVHSDWEGDCTICAKPMFAARVAESPKAVLRIPAGANYVCPMKECGYFAEGAGRCPVCGMNVKPIADVEWARSLTSTSGSVIADAYVCPMHPDSQKAPMRSACSLCGMQMVSEAALKRPTAAPEHVAAQMNYIMEHYLEVQRLLASDRTTDLALHALGLASATEDLSKHARDPAAGVPPEVAVAAAKLHAAALKMTGTLTSDRVTFVDLSAAMRTLVSIARPDSTRWPKLWIYHCPMSKGDWLQASESKRNPYYGFQMLNSGELKGVQ